MADAVRHIRCAIVHHQRQREGPVLEAIAVERRTHHVLPDHVHADLLDQVGRLLAPHRAHVGASEVGIVAGRCQRHEAFGVRRVGGLDRLQRRVAVIRRIHVRIQAEILAVIDAAQEQVWRRPLPGIGVVDQPPHRQDRLALAVSSPALRSWPSALRRPPSGSPACCSGNSGPTPCRSIGLSWSGSRAALLCSPFLTNNPLDETGQWATYAPILPGQKRRPRSAR